MVAVVWWLCVWLCSLCSFVWLCSGYKVVMWWLCGGCVVSCGKVVYGFMKVA